MRKVKNSVKELKNSVVDAAKDGVKKVHEFNEAANEDGETFKDYVSERTQKVKENIGIDDQAAVKSKKSKQTVIHGTASNQSGIGERDVTNLAKTPAQIAHYDASETVFIKMLIAILLLTVFSLWYIS